MALYDICSIRAAESGCAHLPLVGLPDHTGPHEVSGGLSSGLLYFGLALKGEGFLELPGDVELVEVSWGSGYRLEGEERNFRISVSEGA